MSRSAQAEQELRSREMERFYDAMGEHPPRVHMRENDSVYADIGAHTLPRHGPDVPLSDLEARIYGNPPWPRAENWSYKWLDESTMNRTVNEYLEANWDTIRSDLATTGFHEQRFNVGRVVGEGYYNANRGMPSDQLHPGFPAGPRSAAYGQTSMAEITIRPHPAGDPRKLVVVRAFPSGRGIGG
jgi:hypothetical protein